MQEKSTGRPKIYFASANRLFFIKSAQFIVDNLFLLVYNIISILISYLVSFIYLFINLLII
jgi:hypothetical protein